MKPHAFLRQQHKFLTKKAKNERNFTTIENPVCEDQKSLRILNNNVAELECLKKVFTSIYCKCPVCLKTESQYEK